MRRLSAYRLLTVLTLGAGLTAGVLAVVALGLAHPFEAGAAALCAGVFFVPGLLFLRFWRQLESRELALAHVARLAEERGVAETKILAAELKIPEADAAKILRIAIREGKLRGTIDDGGRFSAESAPRCAACGTAVPRALEGRACPACGKIIPGGT